MKNNLNRYTLLFLAAALIGCMEDSSQDQMSIWKSEKDSLKTELDKITERLSALDKLITEADTNFVKSLTLVTTEEIAAQQFNHYFEIYGKVESDKNVMIYPEYMGTLTSVRVKEGDNVSSGQVLATIDNQVISNQIKELETSYELANTVYEKQARLWEKNIGSELQYLEAKNNKESLESSLATLRSQRAKTIIKAPFSGIVDELFSNPGDLANTQMPFARIVNTKNIYIESEVSEQLIGAVDKGTDVEVHFPSLNETITSTVTETGSFINPENRSFKVKVNLPTGGTDYKPNLLAHLKIKDYSIDSALVVKSSLVQQTSDGKDFLYLLEESENKSTGKRTFVELGREYEGMVEILAGIKPGDIIINEGSRSIRNGQQVRIQNSEDIDG